MKKIMVVALLAMLVGGSSAYAAITSQLDVGDRGPEVTELQTYLATNASIYPSGLITGYFGSLTQEAVRRFQAAQGIVSTGTPETTGYGRVGPRTIARLNALLGSTGGGSQVYWDTVPIMGSPSVKTTNDSATITWTTNEPTQGQLFFSTSPIQANEATGPRQQPFVSGTVVTTSGGLQTNHVVNINNLDPNKTYYYITRGVDSVGNMSMTWPNSTFRTK